MLLIAYAVLSKSAMILNEAINQLSIERITLYFFSMIQEQSGEVERI